MERSFGGGRFLAAAAFLRGRGMSNPINIIRVDVGHLQGPQSSKCDRTPGASGEQE